jgi:hypothetical protein
MSGVGTQHHIREIMANTKAYVVQNQSTADTSTFDLVTGAEGSRSPTAAIVFVNYATDLDTETSDAGVCIGMTDFTNTACFSTNSEDAQPTTSDSQRRQGTTGDIATMMSAGDITELRTFTVAAITGGIQLTPNASGSQYRFVAWLFFGTDAYCEMLGDSTGTSGSYTITHGMTNAPKLGICCTSSTDTTANNFEMAVGIFTFLASTIKQRSVTVGSQNGQPNQRCFTREVYTDKVINTIITAFDGTEYNSNDVSDVDATAVTVDNDTTTQPSDVLWLILECDDVEVFLDTVDTPVVDSSDWDYTGLSFQPQFAAGFMNMSDSEAAGGSTNWADAKGGTLGCLAFDEEDSMFTALYSDEEGASTTVTKSRIASNLYLNYDDSTVAFDMDTPSFNGTGFTFAAGDITAVDGTVRKWPMFFIETQVVVVNETVSPPTGPLR